MARNKYPQETIHKILDVAQELFLTKGYEHTSIQDIIDGLGGLTKGAIYHHFRSKEEILSAVLDRLYAGKGDRMAQILANREMTGREKLICSIHDSLDDPNQEQMFQAAPDLTHNPYLLAELVCDSFYQSTPQFLLPIIQEGVADGTITTDQPRELAQVLGLLCNIWINPSVCHGEQRELALRFQFLNKLLAPFRLDVISQDMIDRVLNYQQLYDQKNPGQGWGME